MKPILVTCYVSPDLDGLAGSVAYAEFLQGSGTDAIAAIIGNPHEEARYVLDRFEIQYPQTVANSDAFDRVILVDSSELAGLEGKIAPEKVIEIIDHRKINEVDKFPNAKAQIELVGSASTLIAEKFMQSSTSISKESAILLCGAILSNTLNFKGGVTTDRDRDAYVWLNRVAILSEDFWKELFTAKSDLSGEKLKERIEGDFAWFVMGDKKVGIAQIEMIGAEKLVAERSEEIIKILESIKQDMDTDYIFQNIIELDEGRNYFVTQDYGTQQLLEKCLGVKFNGAVAARPNLIMRKQIVPLLKEELERL